MVRNYEARLCLPSEMYWEFRERISTNPQKDFSNQLVVRWQVTELLIAICRRFMIYLRLWHSRAYALMRDNPLETKRDVEAFFGAVFPSHVRNLQGRHERTDQYLLRHTQLLPRQMLLIMAEILRINSVNDDFEPGRTPFVSEEAIVVGVRDSEDTIVDEIFSAFKDRYGELAKDACMGIIPNLGRVFSGDDFARAVRTFCEEYEKSIPAARLRRMLLEIGAIGKLDKPDSIYIRGRFEYTMTSRLAVGAEEKMCVHPLFSRIFECRPTDGLNAPILPWAADL